MRRVADFTIIIAAFGISAQYALDERWWVVLSCFMVGVIWLLQSHHGAGLGLNFSLLFFAGTGAAGMFFNHNQVWIMTDLVLLLVAWNLDHLSRDLQQYSMAGKERSSANSLVRTRLKRLGVAAVLGWGLGMIALNVRISIGFTSALILASIAVLGLGGAIRYLIRKDDEENPSKPTSA